MYVGGWASRDKLFCVKPAYDVVSENFYVSYLGHEGRHFSDYKIFPKLNQIDLEYRAKFTEIIVSDSTYREMIVKFFHEQKDDRSAPHAYASHLLVQNLSKKLATTNLTKKDQASVQNAAKESNN